MRAAPAAGTRIGRYVVERLLGEGGMGVVVAARHEHLDELVAIKVMHAKLAADPIQAERFAREAKQTVRIRSERVVRVLDAGVQEETGAPYLVMEFLEGRDLGRVLAEDGPLPPSLAVDLMLQVCEAVAAAHALGIIHRDLKPSNFLLTRAADGSPLVKVLDFGIAKALAADGVPDAKLTETHAVFGSPGYMSPEQIRSAKHVDARCDVWSLGVALFELCTGNLPFTADNVAGLVASIVSDAPARMTTFAPGVPEGLEAVVGACLAKEREARTASVAQLAAALVPFASVREEALAIAGRIERIARNSISPSDPSVPLPSRPSLPSAALEFSKTTGADRLVPGPGHRAGRTWGTIAVVLAVAAVVAVAGVLGAMGVMRGQPPDVAATAPPEEATGVLAPALSTEPPAPEPSVPSVPVAPPPVAEELAPQTAPLEAPASPRSARPGSKKSAKPPPVRPPQNAPPTPPPQKAPPVPVSPSDPARDRL
jgi:eukaryotic-like serine/threonine-protein kinase